MKGDGMIEERLAPVLEVAREHAPQVDADGTFPKATMDALRASGLLGLTLPSEIGGLGAGPVEFVETLSALASACGSSSLVYLMHISAATVVAAAPPPGLREAPSKLASGDWLGTLAFSERGSRSHFWAPVSRAVLKNGGVHIAADKSWVTSAGQADLYVVSTRAVAPADAVSLYAVPGRHDGLTVAGPWLGMGMRGNASSPVAVDAVIDEDQRLGAADDGFRLMMEVVLPWFNLGSAAVSVGLAEAAVRASVEHSSAARFEHLGTALADLPTIRAALARMRIALETQRAYLRTSAESVATPDEETLLHVLAVKAAANDAALAITDDAMRVCGGAAYSKHLAVDRFFRDARAGSVMAPTADALYDFYGKAITGRDLFS
ncbi:MAG TPA: acyl-CoA dehydrogenase family protein [Actinomycetota bacterium]|nr:acyl-CoA dehydrogenase family protein [Actinomycetota bacterium]